MGSECGCEGVRCERVDASGDYTPLPQASAHHIYGWNREAPLCGQSYACLQTPSKTRARVTTTGHGQAKREGLLAILHGDRQHTGS